MGITAADGRVNMDGTQPRRAEVVGLGVLVEGGLALVAWILGRLLGYPAAATLHGDAGAALLGVAASLPMLLLFAACVRWPVGPLARIQKITDEVIRPLFTACTLLDLALIATLAGLGEELLFRGVLQSAFGAWLGVWAGLAATNVLFGLLHPLTATYVVLAAALGVYLSSVWLASGNLLVVIVAHAVYDFCALVYVTRARNASG